MINWKKIEEIYRSKNIKELYLIRNNTKTKIALKDIRKILWDLSENTNFVLQDLNGKILYKTHKVTKGGEIVPNNGTPNYILNWKNYSISQKSTLMKILIAQINV